jgi:hypothetical protein
MGLRQQRVAHLPCQLQLQEEPSPHCFISVFNEGVSAPLPASTTLAPRAQSNILSTGGGVGRRQGLEALAEQALHFIFALMADLPAEKKVKGETLSTAPPPADF